MNDERNSNRTDDKKRADLKDASPPPHDGHGNTTDLPEWLGRGLRDLYDDALNDPVPDDFKKLLDQLDRKSES